MKILPALRPVVARTTQEARAKFEQLQELLDPLVGLQRLSHTFGDLSRYPLDGPVPIDELGPSGIRSLSAQLRERVKRQKPTIRELYKEVAGMGGFCLIGTPSEIVDVMQDWYENDACDGFNITPTHLPGGCEDFVEMITPELQRRGLFRTEYEGGTFRREFGSRETREQICRSAPRLTRLALCIVATTHIMRQKRNGPVGPSTYANIEGMRLLLLAGFRLGLGGGLLRCGLLHGGVLPDDAHGESTLSAAVLRYNQAIEVLHSLLRTRPRAHCREPGRVIAKSHFEADALGDVHGLAPVYYWFVAVTIQIEAPRSTASPF